MESVTYHDEEKISYEYDAGGQVIRVTGLREDDVTPTVFVERIGYDEFGQRSYLEYGNGDVTTYTYDEKRRWLTTLSTESQWGRNLQNLSYRFDDVGNIEERTDASDRYTSTQSYTYDGLYQLETAGGTYINKPSGHTSWTDTYSQTFTYDGLGNLEQKVSTERRSPSASASPLNYDLSYTYDEERPHLATKIGELYYSYDANGNMTRESTLPGGQSSASQLPNLTTIGDVRRADQAFGFINEVEDDDQNEYIRTFSWDAENRLKTVLTSNGRSVRYLYDADGIRTTKYAGDGAYTEGLSGETLYYNQWWTETEDSGSFRRAKHIYVGQERIVTRLSNPAIGGSPYEDVNTYYYHPDHLGSAHSITDSEGNPYERIEYTPYGEMWIEIQEDDATESYNYIPFRFTGKEYDQETGLYYYGARYLDPKTSRWVSGDPAGYELMNPMDTEGKPRQGYSIVEATNWYSYVSNNPVKYVDPTGLESADAAYSQKVAEDNIVFNKDNPINQHDMDSWYGLADTFDDSVSCLTAALVNAYGFFGEVPKKALDKVMAMDDNGLSTDGSPSDGNKFMALLGAELGLDNMLQYSGENSDGMLGYFAPGNDNAGVGIARSTYTSEKTGKLYQHFTVLTPQVIDSLAPNRASAGKYEIQEIRGLEWRRRDEM